MRSTAALESAELLLHRGASANGVDCNAIGMLREICRLERVGIANAALIGIVVHDGRGNGGMKGGVCCWRRRLRGVWGGCGGHGFEITVDFDG